MQVSDPFIRIHHGQFRTFCISGLDVSFNFSFFVSRQRFNLEVKISQTHSGGDAKLFESGSMLLKNILKIDFYNVPKKDRIGNFHHGGFKVQRQQQIIMFHGVLHLCFSIVTEGFFAHDCSIDNFAGFQGQFLHEYFC